MKIFFTLIFLILITSCAKPVNPLDVTYPVYGSTEANINGSITSCNNCLILEIKDFALRANYSDNGQEECSGQGSITYKAEELLTMPSELNTTLSYSLQTTMDVSSKNPVCFPEQLIIDIEKIDETNFELNFNGKYFKINKIN